MTYNYFNEITMKKIIYLIVVLVVVGVFFYLWQNRHVYFFQGEKPYEIYNEETKENKKNDKDVIKDENGESSESDNNEADQNNSEASSDELLDILQNHCDNGCEDKKNNADYKYCLEICGIRPSEETKFSGCDEISDDFEKNVCYKNQAIKEKNPGICDKISNSLLQDNCRDRVIEEIF